MCHIVCTSIHIHIPVCGVGSIFLSGLMKRKYCLLEVQKINMEEKKKESLLLDKKIIPGKGEKQTILTKWSGQGGIERKEEEKVKLKQ